MEIIKSISYDQYEIMENILRLHVPQGRIDIDPTYSKGVFYKNGRIPEPLIKTDISPVRSDVLQADCRNLPFADRSFNCIMFDPPFVIGGIIKKTSKINSSLTGKRFGYFTSFKELKDLYKPSISEFYRLLKKDGVVIFKCQDVVVSGKQHFSHNYIFNQAVKQGFYPKDLFIQLSKSRLTDKRKQQHARKYHCYWWVFQKKNNTVEYDIT